MSLIGLFKFVNETIEELLGKDQAKLALRLLERGVALENLQNLRRGKMSSIYERISSADDSATNASTKSALMVPRRMVPIRTRAFTGYTCPTFALEESVCLRILVMLPAFCN
jgi:hypothetical protein